MTKKSENPIGLNP